ncbi:MAG: hypothetical protein R2854_30085 [Caldilineaceae bacterium]
MTSPPRWQEAPCRPAARARGDWQLHSSRLPRADQTPDAVARWLDLAEALVPAEDASAPLQADLAYARARVLAQSGPA